MSNPRQPAAIELADVNNEAPLEGAMLSLDDLQAMSAADGLEPIEMVRVVGDEKRDAQLELQPVSPPRPIQFYIPDAVHIAVQPVEPVAPPAEIQSLLEPATPQYFFDVKTSTQVKDALGHELFLVTENDENNPYLLRATGSRRLVYREVAASHLIQKHIPWQPLVAVRATDEEVKKDIAVRLNVVAGFKSFADFSPAELLEKLIATIRDNGFADQLIASLVLDNVQLGRKNIGFDANGKVVVDYVGDYFASLDPDMRKKCRVQRERFTERELENPIALGGGGFLPNNWLGFYTLKIRDNRTPRYAPIYSPHNNIFGVFGRKLNNHPDFLRAKHRAILKWLLKSDEMITQDVHAGVPQNIVIDNVNQAEEIIEFVQARRNVLLGQSLLLKTFQTYLRSMDVLADIEQFSHEQYPENPVKSRYLQRQCVTFLGAMQGAVVEHNGSEVVIRMPEQPVQPSQLTSFFKNHIKGIYTGAVVSVIVDIILVATKTFPLAWPAIGYCAAVVAGGVVFGTIAQTISNFYKAKMAEKNMADAEHSQAAKSKRPFLAGNNAVVLSERLHLLAGNRPSVSANYASLPSQSAAPKPAAPRPGANHV